MLVEVVCLILIDNYLTKLYRQSLPRYCSPTYGQIQLIEACKHSVVYSNLASLHEFHRSILNPIGR